MKKKLLSFICFLLAISILPICNVNNAFAVTGQTHKVLTILANFTDLKIKYSDSEWNKKLFGQNMKSLKDFYLENSNNLCNLIPAEENSGVQNDGIVRINLNMVTPNCKDGPGIRNSVIKAAVAASAPYVNFNSFGKELKIIVIFAGEGTDLSITPCNFPRVLPNISIDTLPEAIKTQTVASMGELYSTYGMVPLGGIVHEFGHMLGLIDLYPIIRYQSTMGRGGDGTISTFGDCPTNLDPWSKIKLGFLDPQSITTSGYYSLNAASSGRNGNYNALKIPNSANPKEYFLIERRDILSYDQGLVSVKGFDGSAISRPVPFKSQGIYIWHIDENKPNNNDVDIITNNTVTIVKFPLPFKYSYQNYTSYGPDMIKFNDGTSPGLTVRIVDKNADGIVNPENIHLFPSKKTPSIISVVVSFVMAIEAELMPEPSINSAIMSKLLDLLACAGKIKGSTKVGGIKSRIVVVSPIYCLFP